MSGKILVAFFVIAMAAACSAHSAHAQNAPPQKPAAGNTATPPNGSSVSDTGQPVDKSGWSSSKNEAPQPSAAQNNATSSEMVPARTPPRPGMVWADHDTKIYHGADSPGYGRTQGGKWMTEDEAKKAGYKPMQSK